MANATHLQRFSLALAIAIAGLSAGLPKAASAQQSGAAASAKPVTVEWAYRVKYGFKDEWWQLFKKNQISVLEKQKQLGYVKEYTVYAPSLHTSEDSRWDYRIIITYPNYDGSRQEGAVEDQLFKDKATFEKEEDRRWELTLNHWDLPIHQIDPHADRE